MNRIIRIWAVVLGATLAFGTHSWAQQRVTNNENVTNKTTRASAASTRDGKARKVDLNTATREDLEALPGVGVATANAIIAARPFKSVNELKDVSGIGDARYDQIKPHVTVRSTKESARARGDSSGAPAASTSRSGTGGSDKPTAEAQSRNNVPPGSRSAGDGGGVVRTDPRHSGSDKPGAREKEESRVPKASTSSERSRSSGKVNLNTASKEELEALPGIGPVKAQAIIDARPYRSIEDVMKVKGIKEGTFDEIRDEVTVR